jgi:hypothetical protein
LALIISGKGELSKTHNRKAAEFIRVSPALFLEKNACAKSNGRHPNPVPIPPKGI